MKQRVNPYLPSWEYIPDGEPYVFGDRVYVYGSHDRFNGYVFCLNDYVCWSAPVNDLSDWRYEGVIYRKTDDPLNRDSRMCLHTRCCWARWGITYYVLTRCRLSRSLLDTPAASMSPKAVHYPDGTRLERERGSTRLIPACSLRVKERTTLASVEGATKPERVPW